MDCELGRISVAESTKEARAYRSTNRGTTNDRDEVRVMARPNVDRVDGGKMRGGRGEMGRSRSRILDKFFTKCGSYFFWVIFSH